jgi:hypothetical protein
MKGGLKIPYILSIFILMLIQENKRNSDFYHSLFMENSLNMINLATD